MPKFKNTVAYLGFVITVIGLGLMYVHYYLPLSQKTATEQSPLAFSFYDLHAKEYNDNGVKTQSLVSQKLIHSVSSNESQLEHPKIQIVKNDSPWNIEADNANVSDNQQKVELMGHVVIRQFKNNQVISQLKTDKLTYYPNSQTIKTQADVTFSQQGLTIQAQGLIADLNKQTVEFRRKIRSVYVPKVG